MKKTQRVRTLRQTLLGIVNGILSGPHCNFENSVFKGLFPCILEVWRWQGFFLGGGSLFHL